MPNTFRCPVHDKAEIIDSVPTQTEFFSCPDASCHALFAYLQGTVTNNAVLQVGQCPLEPWPQHSATVEQQPQIQHLGLEHQNQQQQITHQLQLQLAQCQQQKEQLQLQLEWLIRHIRELQRQLVHNQPQRAITQLASPIQQHLPSDIRQTSMESWLVHRPPTLHDVVPVTTACHNQEADRQDRAETSNRTEARRPQWRLTHEQSRDIVLRREGGEPASFQTIANAVGVSKSTAWRHSRKHMDQTKPKQKDDL